MKWKKDIERQFRFFGLTDPEVKKDGLIIYGGSQIAELEESVPDLPPQESEDVYSRFIRKLDRNFLPGKNKDYPRFQFGNLSQEADESIYILLDVLLCSIAEYFYELCRILTSP